MISRRRFLATSAAAVVAASVLPRALRVALDGGDASGGATPFRTLDGASKFLNDVPVNDGGVVQFGPGRFGGTFTTRGPRNVSLNGRPNETLLEVSPGGFLIEARDGVRMSISNVDIVARLL